MICSYAIRHMCVYSYISVLKCYYWNDNKLVADSVSPSRVVNDTRNDIPVVDDTRNDTELAAV